jgi:hypothetical protein
LHLRQFLTKPALYWHNFIYLFSHVYTHCSYVYTHCFFFSYEAFLFNKSAYFLTPMIAIFFDERYQVSQKHCILYMAIISPWKSGVFKFKTYHNENLDKIKSNKLPCVVWVWVLLNFNPPNQNGLICGCFVGKRLVQGSI